MTRIARQAIIWTFSAVVLTGLAVAFFVLRSNKTHADTKSGLVLKVQCMNLNGTITNVFAINEPVLLSFELLNTKSVPITLILGAKDEDGIRIRLLHGDEANVRVVPEYPFTDALCQRRTFRPQEKIIIGVVPMSHFLQVKDKGAFVFECEKGFVDEKNEGFFLRAIVPLQFVNSLDAQEIGKLADQLRRRFDSGDMDTRILMLKTSVVFPPSAVTPL